MGWVEAAARLGHEPARRALGHFVPVITAEALPEVLAGWGRQALVRALLGLASPEALQGWRGCFGDDRLELLGAELGRGATPETALAADSALRLAERELLRRESLEAERQAAEEGDEALDGAVLLPEPRPEDDPDRAREARRAASLLVDLVAALRADPAADGVALEGRDPELPLFAHLVRQHPDFAGDARAVLTVLLREHPRLVPGVRRALAGWVLVDPPGPPPVWADAAEQAAREEARREAEAAFRAALELRESKREATRIRGDLRSGSYEKERVTLAALLGHAPAWLVARARPETGPELVPPTTVAELAVRFEAPIDAGEVGWRADWARRLIVRLALELGERALRRAHAAGASDARLETALAVVRAVANEPSREHAAPARAAATGALVVARRLGRSPAAADARVLHAAAALAARAARGSRPGLQDGRIPLLDAALAAGEAPGPLWERLRGLAIAWLLDRDQVPGRSVREYDPHLRYVPGELLDHRRFGRGRVLEVGRHTMVVAFEGGGARSLVHGARRDPA